MASKEAVADVLDEAVALMDDGERWARRQMWRRDNGARSYCAAGAIQEATRRRYPHADFFLRHGVEKAAILAVANVYHEDAPMQHEAAIKRVTEWNDWETTTWPKLVKRFAAAKRQVMKTQV